jgi:hypothetical protein
LAASKIGSLISRVKAMSVGLNDPTIASTGFDISFDLCCI